MPYPFRGRPSGSGGRAFERKGLDGDTRFGVLSIARPLVARPSRMFGLKGTSGLGAALKARAVSRKHAGGLAFVDVVGPFHLGFDPRTTSTCLKAGWQGVAAQ